jgi:guanylate kinase
MIEAWIGEGSDVILDIDVQGSRAIKCQYPDSVTIFILPPSWEELEKRLRHRGTDSEETILKRLYNARGEVAEAFWYEYLVINDDVSRAASQIVAIISSFRCRTRNHFDFLRGLLHVDFGSACSRGTAEK